MRWEGKADEWRLRSQLTMADTTEILDTLSTVASANFYEH